MITTLRTIYKSICIFSIHTSSIAEKTSPSTSGTTARSASRTITRREVSIFRELLQVPRIQALEQAHGLRVVPGAQALGPDQVRRRILCVEVRSLVGSWQEA